MARYQPNIKLIYWQVWVRITSTLMLISEEKIKEFVSSAPGTAGKAKYRSLNKIISKLRSNIRAEISTNMQGWLVLLDESVKFFIYYEKYQHSLKLTSQTSPFAMQLSAVRGIVLSIRELVLLGQTSTAQALCRNFIEGIELLMALAEDGEFAEAYFNADDEENFWRKYIGYGKITPRVERFITLGVGNSHLSHLNYHRKLKKFLSGDVHGSASSAFYMMFSRSISQPGSFAVGTIGAIDPNMRTMCRVVASETQLFSACVINIFTKKIHL